MKKSTKILLSILSVLFLAFCIFVSYKSIYGLKTDVCFIFCSNDPSKIIYGFEVVKYYVLLLFTFSLPILIISALIYFSIDLFKAYKKSQKKKMNKTRASRIGFTLLLFFAYLLMFIISILFLIFILKVLYFKN